MFGARFSLNFSRAAGRGVAQKAGQELPVRQTLPPAHVRPEQCEKPHFRAKIAYPMMAWGLRQRLAEQSIRISLVSLNGIAASAISALKTNSAALSVVSNNVSNLNTPGYARRVVNQQTLAAGGQLMGVDIASVQRVTNQFLHQEQLVGRRRRLAIRHHGQPVLPAERPSGRPGRQPVAGHRPDQSGQRPSPPPPRRPPPAPATPA